MHLQHEMGKLPQRSRQLTGTCGAVQLTLPFKQEVDILDKQLERFLVNSLVYASWTGVIGVYSLVAWRDSQMLGTARSGHVLLGFCLFFLAISELVVAAYRAKNNTKDAGCEKS